ncbi:MAG: hypothetical protein SFZ23_09545 [Planctomycetota bacterium]|nr:hypothetical protein [Planctomycetota bacterium]
MLRAWVTSIIQSIQPWIDAGFSGFWMDAASSNGSYPPNDLKVYGRRLAQLELSFQPYFRSQNVRFGGENIPISLVNNVEAVDDCSVALCSWLAISTQPTRYFERQGQPVREFKSESPEGWFFDRARSEVFFVPDTSRSLTINSTKYDEPPITFAEFGEARRRGFVLALYNLDGAQQSEYVKRWYSMGDIFVADFNADGSVDLSDVADMNEAVDRSLLRQQQGLPVLKVFANGEFNQDPGHVIDENDRAYWMQQWLLCMQNPNGACAIINYGGPDDL